MHPTGSHAEQVTIVPERRIHAVSEPNEFLEKLHFTWEFSAVGPRATRCDLKLAFVLRTTEHCLMWDLGQDAIISEYLSCFQRRCGELSDRAAGTQK